MHGSQAFSEVTKAYLCRFYSILDEMIAKMTKAQPTNSMTSASSPAHIRFSTLLRLPSFQTRPFP